MLDIIMSLLNYILISRLLQRNLEENCLWQCIIFGKTCLFTHCQQVAKKIALVQSKNRHSHV